MISKNSVYKTNEYVAGTECGCNFKSQVKLLVPRPFAELILYSVSIKGW